MVATSGFAPKPRLLSAPTKRASNRTQDMERIEAAGIMLPAPRSRRFPMHSGLQDDKGKRSGRRLLKVAVLRRRSAVG